MTRGPAVVLAWGLVNAALLLILAGFGGSAMELWLYGGACGLVGLFAAAAFVSSRRHPLPVRRYRVVPETEAAAALAVACAFGGLTLVFGLWFVPLVVPPFAVAVSLFATKRPGARQVTATARRG
ncbi:MAG TPA: hypothetical protein VE991_13685 [Acidimicrobiales bacterium]|nr:hypothetical protein [Acidimicrobiales bacterium]